MKKLLLLLPLLLVGCGSLRKSIVVEHATHDTLYINTLKYDSIYIDRYREVEHKPATVPGSSAAGYIATVPGSSAAGLSAGPDTVIIHEKEREYRYRLIHDTTRIVKVDSIPIIHEVQVVKHERYIPAIYKWALGICIMTMIIVIMIIVIRIVNLRDG